MLSCKQVTHSFDYKLFENIDLSIDRGESISLIGRSGSGKSTLLHILATLLKPQSGAVFFEDKNIYSLNDAEMVKIRRDDFGIIFQSHYLFRGFSAFENLEVASILSKEKLDYSLFKKLKVDSVLSQPIGTLSGGQQQRISIARVLSKKPKVIFADEPTGNLDKETAKDVIDVIFEYIKEQKATLFLVTHDENLAKLCDRVYRLESRKLVLL